MAKAGTTAKKPAAKAATPTAPAPGEQQDNLPPGTIDATAPGAVATVPNVSGEAPGATPAGNDAGGTTGLDAQPIPESAGTVAGAPPSPPAPSEAEPPLAGVEDSDDGDVEGLWITAIPEQGFRRCGLRFTREGFGVALSALTEAQIEQLENEPNLKVERGLFSGLVE